MSKKGRLDQDLRDILAYETRQWRSVIRDVHCHDSMEERMDRIRSYHDVMKFALIHVQRERRK